MDIECNSCLFVKFVLYTGRVSWGGDPANLFVFKEMAQNRKAKPPLA
jgi:hypothetical protein